MKTKRLLVAVCLLLIAATMLSTASFAWFSMNTEVAVDGIEVEAYSDALFLEISQTTNDADFDISTTIESTEEKKIRLVTRISQTGAVYVTSAPATAEYFTAGDNNVYYVMGDKKADALSEFNYIKVDSSTLTPATDLSSLVAVVFAVPTETVALEDVTYYQVNATNDGYVAMDFEKDDLLTGAARVAVVKTFYEYDGSAKTYTPVTGLLEYDSVTGYYEAVFTACADDATAEDGTTYYTVSDGVYTEVTVNEGDELDGYYTATVPAALGADAVCPALYSYDSADDKYTLAEDVTRGTSLAGYYTISTAAVDLTAAFGKVYVADGDDYVCICNITGASAAEDAKDITNELYWGRAYSNALGQVQGDNTLSALKNPDRTNSAYYFYDTVYLRNAENTNTSSDLRIEEVKIGGRVNALSDALRVLFVATNGAGERKVLEYNNRTGAIEDNGALFASLLGNRGEIVTVDIYVYFDGTDEAAFTLKDGDAGLLNGQTVEVKFTIDEQPWNADN